VLVILVGVAPVALACHATPWTEAAAKLWWRTLLATLGAVILQAIALHTAFSVLLSPDANVPLVGVAQVDDAAAFLNLMIVAVLLWTTVKIPALVARYVTGSQPRSLVATVGRIAMVRQVGRIMSARAGAATRTSSAAASAPSGRYAGASRPAASRAPGTQRAARQAGPRGPRPGQPPRFSYAAAHQPMPRPGTVQPRPTFSHPTRPAVPQPAPTPRPPRQPRFSTPARQPAPASHTAAVAPQPAFSHAPAPQAPRAAGAAPAAAAVRFSDPPAAATPTPRAGRRPVAATPAFSHPRPPVSRTTTPADRTGGEKR
jgi:hypothetical protein